jgi:predicted phage tail protein
MLREIRVYGRLAKFLGKRVFRAEVASAAEAVRFLLANFPQLEKHMADQHYRVSVGTYELAEDELHDPAGQQQIKIIPVVAGAGAVGRIVAGVALLAAAIFIPGFQAWAGPTAYGLIVGVGSSLVLGGVAQLLTPVPQVNPSALGKDTDADPRKSYSFSGVQNTSRQGVPVPVVYGETVVGSVVISAGIDTVQVTDNGSSSPGGTLTNEQLLGAFFKQG